MKDIEEDFKHLLLISMHQEMLDFRETARKQMEDLNPKIGYIEDVLKHDPAFLTYEGRARDVAMLFLVQNGPILHRCAQLYEIMKKYGQVSSTLWGMTPHEHHGRGTETFYLFRKYYPDLVERLDISHPQELRVQLEDIMNEHEE